MSYISFNNVSKSFKAQTVLRDVNLSVERGEFVAIVGFSGTGKSTLINLLAGLVMPDTGTVKFDGRPVLRPGRERGVVFQNYSLLPWMSVYDNIRLGVDAAHPHLNSTDRDAHVKKFIDMVNLTPASRKRPHELSGGMRQRVSVARALAMDPDTLLLDEPLGALDALTRSALQDEIADIWARDRKTVVLITNDVDEGILLADRVIPLLPGPDGATLHQGVRIDLDRPRDRKGLNHCVRFQELRKTIFGLLRSASAASVSENHDGGIKLPEVVPVHERLTFIDHVRKLRPAAVN